MNNFKKLLVTLLALVLLIGSATVIALAADTPAEIIAEAQILLDQATKEGEFIAVRSQKMRELDKLIDTNLSTIKNSQEWRDFQVGYKAAQKQLKEDAVVETSASLDKLLDRETSAAEANALYSGLSKLIALSGDGRGYFDTSSAEFAALNVRMKVAEAIARLQIAEEAVVAKEKGATLLWIENYKASTLLPDEAALATADYAEMTAWFSDVYASVEATLYEEIVALTDEACLATTTFARATALAAEIEDYFNNCYFDNSKPAYGATRMYAGFASVYPHLNEIERTSALLTQGTLLKALAELNGTVALDQTSPMYAAYTARYAALIDATNEDSVVSRIAALLDGYKKEVADVFTEGYAGPLTDTKAIQAIVDEFDGVLATCYVPNSGYIGDHKVASLYAAIYDFYIAMQDLEAKPEDYIVRNNLYKKAVSSYNSITGSTASADPAYKAPLEAIYKSLTTAASLEINEILSQWHSTAQQSISVDAEGAYIVTLADAMDAYNKLQVYYLEKTTALYYSATENKTLTSQIKQGCAKVEERMLAEFVAALTAAKDGIVLPEDLGQTDPELLAAYEAKLAELRALTDDVTFVFGDVEALAAFRHDLYVSNFVVLLAKVEILYAEVGATVEVAALYNELKTFTGANFDKIDSEAPDYLAYLLLLNKTEVKMGDANVPGARPYLDALAAVVDADNFDKVYALMHLDEYIRQNAITRPDASDTTSASAVFYQEYDVLAKKVAAWRQTKVDAREANVPIGDYSISGMNSYDADTKQASAQKNNHTFTAKDGREYGAAGSQYYMTFEYTKGSSSDGFISVNLPSSTENVIIEMDITTFTNWPSGGVSFNSGSNYLESGSRMYPWIGAINGAGQIVAPNGKNHSAGPTLTDREGGYIVPGQWTHFIIVYNAKEKMVSYYVNDEKIVKDGVDAWSCAQSGGTWNFNEALRIGHANSGGGSFSVDNVKLYIGDAPRNTDLFATMSALKKFAYYTDYVKKYIDTNGAFGTAADAKVCYDEILALHVLYWGIKNEGDAEKTYLFDETTYWSGDAVTPVTDITYEQFKAAIDNYVWVAERAGSILDAAMTAEVYSSIQDQVASIESLGGIANLAKRKGQIATFKAYIETNASYIGMFTDSQRAVYDACLAKIAAIETELGAYERANEYIEMVNKFAAAKDLYSRTVYRSQALLLMQMMETDAALGYFDLDNLKIEVTEFAEAIERYNEQSALLDAQLIQDNNEIIIDCMSRFPATPEEAMKNYAYLNKYIVLVRRIITEGTYNPSDVLVQEALVIYDKMNASFYDALQKDHAAQLQALIDQFNAETAYITRLGIYTAVTNYLEENASTIDREHSAINAIYTQYAVMDEQFGSEEGKEEQWAEYETILKANALKFANLVVQMRFCESYAELRSLREQAAALYYYMDSSSAEAKLAVEYYHATELLLAQKALDGDAFIDAAYALTKATTMADTYKALLAARAAFLKADTTYEGVLTYTEKSGEITITTTFTMADAVSAYTIALSNYNSFVTVINNEVDVVLDVACAVRATYPVNQTIVAIFKKFYD